MNTSKKDIPWGIIVAAAVIVVVFFMLVNYRITKEIEQPAALAPSVPAVVHQPARPGEKPMVRDTVSRLPGDTTVRSPSRPAPVQAQGQAANGVHPVYEAPLKGTTLVQ